MKKSICKIAAVLTVGLLSGCGGDGGGGSSATVAGAVADGYLVGATVFLDKNGNYRLDSGEPSTTSDFNGAYSLTVEPADVGRYPIVAIAVRGVTIDKDTDQAVRYSYIMSMPRESVSGTVNSNFISPISTQVRELMGTGQYTMEQAMSELRRRLGLSPDANVMADYMANRDDQTYRAMHTAAQNMATLMGSQEGSVFVNGSVSSVDVNRYRGMMGAIFSNISSVRGSRPDSWAAMDSLMGSMATELQGMMPGQPFRNMSTSFRGGMMGGRSNDSSQGSMMSYSTGSTGSTSSGMMGSGAGMMR